MKRRLKIVAIGVGSEFGRGILADILGSPEFSQTDCTLTLVDIHEPSLDRMYAFGLLLKEHFASTVTIEKTSDRTQALPSADYVITSVAIQRYPLWEQDFRIPLAYGFKHVLGENGGPGAAFHAMRNYELILPIARDMEKLCPHALLLNYTNPESRIIMAVSSLTSVRSVGLCHGTMGARDAISLVLERPLDELDIISGGLNHFFWVMRIADKRSGEDLYPQLRERVLHDPNCPKAPPLIRKMLEIFGCYTYPSDDHVGEYVSFAHEFTGLKWHRGREGRPVPRLPEAAAESPIDACVSGRRPLDNVIVRKSSELAVPIILGIELDRKNWECAVNVPNDGAYVENIDRAGIVEVPAIMDRHGVHPQKIGALPEALAAFCNRQVSIQKLLVEAYAKRSRTLLLQTLLLDPVVDSVDRAQRMMDDMLALQSDYLPTFA